MNAIRAALTGSVLVWGFAGVSVARAGLLPVTGGLTLWLDAADPATVFLDGSNLIERWEDKSGNNYHATQSDPAKRPALNATAVNGLPGVRFDGSNDGLSISDSLSLSRPYTAFIVDQYYGSPQGRTLQSRDINWLMGKWGGKNGHYANGWVNDPNANPAGTGNPVIGTAVGTTVNSQYFINGINKTTSGSPTGVPGKLGMVSSGAYPAEVSQADIAEIVIYNRVLSYDERQLVGSYLASKWGLGAFGSPTLGTVSTFTGADPGEGLDLTGTHFPYAVNMRGPQVTVGSLTFTEDGGPGAGGSTPGFSVQCTNSEPTWSTKPDYGTTPADDALETMMHSIRWSTAPSDVQVAMNVVPGRQYKLQLLFSENMLGRPPGSRVFDIEVEGQLAFDELDLNDVMGYFPSAPITKGLVYTQTLRATDNQLNVRLAPGSGGTDKNPILQAVTLEDLSTQVGVFTGGDPGEGLDFQGLFQYAINFAAPGGFTIGDARFTDQNTPGVTISAENSIDNWYTPNFGTSANDDNLELVMDSIRWSDAAPPGTEEVNIRLDNLLVGQWYKLQLLFQEGCCGRGFDVYIEDALTVNDFSPIVLVGGSVDVTKGAVITHEFLASDSTLTIRLDGRGTSFPDKNPIIQGLTLETIPEPSAVVLGVLGAIGLGASLARRRKAA